MAQHLKPHACSSRMAHTDMWYKVGVGQLQEARFLSLNAWRATPPYRHCHHHRHRHRHRLHSLRVGAGIQIDRRQYLDHLFKRQLEFEAREAEASLSCPLECVREVYNYNEFERVLHEADIANELVMVDFYSSSCGACKYLLPQVIRLCKKGCEDSCDVTEGRRLVFLKHNVRDEYDELTDLARFYAIRAVPVFTFFMNGSPIEHVFTRDQQHLQKAVCQIRERFLE